MKLINSLNNFKNKIFDSSTKTVVKNNVKRFWVLGLLYFIAIFVMYPFNFMINSDMGHIYNDYRNTFKEMLLLRQEGMEAIFFTIVFAFILGLVLSRYMHDKDEMIFTHSLPTSRFDNYKNSFVSFLFLIVTPLFTNGVIIAIEKIIFKFTTYRYINILYFMFSLLLIAFVIYAITMFSSALSGTTVFSGLYTLFFVLLPVLLYGSYQTLMSEFVIGYYANDTHMKMVMDCTPLVRFFMLDENRFTWLSAILYLLAGIIILGLGYYLYKIRKNEKTTETLVFEINKPILKYLITALSVYPFLFTFGAISNNNIYVAIFGAVLGIFLSYFIMEMIIQKSFFVWNKYKGFLISVGVFALCVLAIKFDVFGYTNYVPNIDKVESVYFGNEIIEWNDISKRHLTEEGYVYSGVIFDYGELTDNFISDEETIKKTINLHKAIIDNSINSFDLYSNRFNMTMRYDYAATMDEYYYSTYVAYKLKNGKTIIRYFSFNINACIEEYETLMNDQKYKEEQVKDVIEVLNNDAYEFEFANINNEFLQTYNTKENDLRNFIQIVVDDYLNTEYSYYSDYIFGYERNCGSLVMDLNYFDKNDVEKYKDFFNHNNLSEAQIEDVLRYFVRLPLINYNFTNTIDYIKNDPELSGALMSDEWIDEVDLIKIPKRMYEENWDTEIDVPIEKMESSYDSVFSELDINLRGIEPLRITLDEAIDMVIATKSYETDEEPCYYFLLAKLSDYARYTQDAKGYYAPEYVLGSVFSKYVPTELKEKCNEINNNYELDK
ncbi:MAG: hypothetical protein MJ245_04580 [Clostridia bacterium]|nr:hypothetical protein [Clostridia bacterium]